MPRLAGAGGAGPARTVRTASATPTVSASATGGSSWSCVHIPLKAARRGLRPGAVLQSIAISRFPIGCGSICQTLAHSHFLARTSALAQEHPSLNSLANPFEEHGLLNPCGTAGWAGTQSWTQSSDALVKQLALANPSKFCVSVIRCRIRRAAGNGLGARKAYAGTRPMRTS
jgi:hypothetical protein